MSKIKAFKTTFNEQEILKNIDMASTLHALHNDATVVLSMSIETMNEIERQCGVQYPIAKFENQTAYGRRGTIAKYFGNTVLQNNELPFGEVKIMIEVF